ncbi:MAG: peptidoglycan-binding protein [Scytolyngbya sp. HA4215-MV1]|jgi:peptidoglycan hydrolase-like protein with peptidoglycan-binding domain|nr:peptidoglycan-binding protein [Scytolyngbya sp. HA4215-MV1]
MNIASKAATTKQNDLSTLTDDVLTLSEPMSGSLTVAILQRLLILEGYGTLPDGSTLPTTGNFLDETNAAVINFQQAMGLQPDGIVGQETWLAIAQGYTSNAD